ncbi:hypothetical protein [Fibrella arboris]|uniref:hypothetical protein n=1 Tax=Fibrella arboris TaxID=3242486 RepID=UPI0035210A52
MKTTRTASIGWLLFSCLLLFGQCRKTETQVTPVTPDPLANAAGTYTGTMTDTGRLYQAVKASVTTAKDSYGKLYVNSVGFSGTAYQLVLANPSPLSARAGSYEYRASSVVADGKSLNVSGRYTLADRWGLSSAIYYDFSFTGTR